MLVNLARKNLFYLFSIGNLLISASAIAFSQTFPFNAIYKNTATSTLILSEPNFFVSLVEFQGISQDAPYGLTQLSGKTYSKVNILTGELFFNTDPTVFGLDFPQGSLIFQALDGSQLIGPDIATSSIDSNTLIATSNATFTIAQGTGGFSGATGTFKIFEVSQLSLDPSVPVTGTAQVSGSFQIPTVSEPSSVLGLVVLGLLFLRKSTKHG